jgi:uncharacterized protein YqjF (DUF2071 family)
MDRMHQTVARPAAGPRSVFLTARWLDLAMLDFEIDPKALAPLVPRDTELDRWQGRALVSLVGFLFHGTRVLGVPVPFHRHFREVNLRFYVRRRTEDGWRRGVVFVKEYASRRAVSWVARRVYGENYATARIGHAVNAAPPDPRAPRSAAYWWRAGGREHRLEVDAVGPPHHAAPGGLEEFIVENYWGYSSGLRGGTLEYRVDHPRWNLWPGERARFAGDAAQLYGPRFAGSLTSPPVSSLIADGSPVTVYRGRQLADV